MIPDSIRLSRVTSTAEWHKFLDSASSNFIHTVRDDRGIPTGDYVNVFDYTSSAKLIIEDPLILRTFKFHNLHKHLEWSGILLYTNNSFDLTNMDDIEVKAIDFVPMDLGSYSYTSINFKDESLHEDKEAYIPDIWSDERIENQHLQIQTGWYHTHHSLSGGAYFSGVDLPNLINQSKAYANSMYVGLIACHNHVWANKKDRWKARIAWRTKFNKKTGKYDLFNHRKKIAEFDEDVCIMTTCDVRFNFEVDETDHALQRYKTLFAPYAKHYFRRDLHVKDKYMEYFYQELTSNILSKWDAKKYYAWLSNYSDDLDWYIDSCRDIVLKTLSAGCYPFPEYEEFSYSDSFIVLKVLQRHFKDIASMPKNKLKTTLINNLKKYTLQHQASK